MFELDSNRLNPFGFSGTPLHLNGLPAKIRNPFMLSRIDEESCDSLVRWISTANLADHKSEFMTHRRSPVAGTDDGQ